MSKTVFLHLPLGKDVKLTGGVKDRSIVGVVEASEGFYEPHVMSMLSSILKVNSICIDIGANIGALSLAFADVASEGKVYSIEVGNDNYQYLTKNITQNRFDNIIPIYKAVSDYNGTAIFNYVDEVAGCSFISTTGVKEGVQEEVEVTTLDDIVVELGLKSVDFIKLDVEGGELKALVGAENTIEKFHPILLIEWNPATMRRFYDEEPKKLFDFLISKWSTIELIGENSFVSINTYEELNKIVDNGKGWEDLVCRF